MDILIRMTSKDQTSHSEEYSWPPDIPLTLPNVGDAVDVLDLGFRTVTRRSFTYNSSNSGNRPDATQLIVDISCE
jgi:hypothetical protein